MINKPAPAFSLPDQDGINRSLEDYKGRWLVLYFYPKDGSIECTTEACSFRDEYSIIAQFGNAEIIGINKDSVASHKRFASQNKLTFPLLSDAKDTICQQYGTWEYGELQGQMMMHVQRRTFLINPQGKIIKQYHNVSLEDHASQIIQDLQALQTS